MSLGGASLRVRRLGGSRAGELRLTRFLRNEAVTEGEMLAEARERTAVRCAGRDVLAIQDTSVIRSDGGGGDDLHVVLAVDAADETLLGLVDAQVLRREAGRREHRRGALVEDKESFRWLQGADEAAQACACAERVTVVADRECDIFEAFALRPDGAEMLVRAAQDRALGEGGRLFAALDALPEAGRCTLDLPAGPGRAARTAALALRFATTTLARPRDAGRDAGLPRAVAVQVVDVCEANPPPGAACVHWRLLTTHPVGNAAEAWKVAELYRKRWAIEQLFRTLKTKGFDIEGMRVEHPAARDKLAVAALVAATAVQQLIHARDGYAQGGAGPLRPCTDVFEPEDTALLDAFCAKLEGKTARQKNPHPPGSLAYAAWVCARLGGWTGYYGKPGPIVMFNGWLEVQAARRTIRLLSWDHDV